MRELFIRSEFWDDVAAAVRWYQHQEPGLGHRLIEEIKEAAERIEAFPESCRQVHGSVRKTRLKRFPYAVYYRITGDQVRILLLLHEARDVRAIEKELKLRS